jgi:hypothetical protein
LIKKVENAVVQKHKKEGKLMKESEIEDVVKFETYKKLYKYLGGWKLLVPFVIAVSLFNVIEYQKSLAVNKWAHLQASE